MKHKNLLALTLAGLSMGLTSCCRNCNEDRIPSDCGCPSNYDACRELSCDEIYFANLLTERNRKAFCGRFSAEERRAAMLASCNGAMNCGADRNAGKKVMKPDDAVSEIMRQNNMTMAEKREECL